MELKNAGVTMAGTETWLLRVSQGPCLHPVAATRATRRKKHRRNSSVCAIFKQGIEVGSEWKRGPKVQLYIGDLQKIRLVG